MPVNQFYVPSTKYKFIFWEFLVLHIIRKGFQNILKISYTSSYTIGHVIFGINPEVQRTEESLSIIQQYLLVSLPRV